LLRSDLGEAYQQRDQVFSSLLWSSRAFLSEWWEQLFNQVTRSFGLSWSAVQHSQPIDSRFSRTAGHLVRR